MTIADDQIIIDSGYKPQLHRSLKFVSSFAVSFSFMSVLMGVFANYGYLLGKAGAFGIWTWVLVACGQTIVSLVFAELACCVPLTGAIYNWNGKLGHPAAAWIAGWLIAFAYIIGTVGVITAIIAPLQTFLGVEFTGRTPYCVGIGIILVQAIINIYGVRLAAQVNKLAVFGEIIALVGFGGALAAVLLIHGDANLSLLTTKPVGVDNYWTGFLMASILAAWTIFGFETPSDLSEETIDVRRIAPKSIVSSVLATSVIGFLFLAVLTVAIPDVKEVTASADPISAIVSAHLGVTLNRVFLLFVLLAIFASSLVAITAASRLLFAMARDGRFPASALFSRVSQHGVPRAPVMLVATIEIVTLCMAKDMTELYAIPVVLLTLAYLITVLNYASGIKRLPASDSFTLGRWRRIVVALATVWLVTELGILTIPSEFHMVAFGSLAVIAVGLVVYALVGRRTAVIRSNYS